MSIKIDFTPIRALGQLATEAGIAEADAGAQQMREKAILMKMQHDFAMREAELHAGLQADAQYRENMFNSAIQGEQFQQNRLTLEEQYGYNIKLARAKADIDLQADVAEYAMKKKRLDAWSDSIRNSKILTDQQKENIIASLSAELVGGKALGAGMFTPHLNYRIENIGGVPMNVAYDPYGGKQVLGEAGKVQTVNPVDAEIAKVMQGTGVAPPAAAPVITGISSDPLEMRR